MDSASGTTEAQTLLIGIFAFLGVNLWRPGEPLAACPNQRRAGYPRPSGRRPDIRIAAQGLTNELGPAIGRRSFLSRACSYNRHNRPTGRGRLTLAFPRGYLGAKKAARRRVPRRPENR